MTLKKSYYILASLSFVLLIVRNNVLLSNETLHRYLASDWEENVRNGEVLPESAVNLTCLEKKFRFLVIGGKTSTGYGLASRDESFPAHLCGADVIAEESISPLAVSSCLKNLVGDTVYDVILLDLFEVADEYLHVIMKRLRNRFPDAHIISLRQYYPILVGFQHRNGWVTVADWAKSACAEAEGKNATLACFKKSAKPWQLKMDNKRQQFFQNITVSKEFEMTEMYKDINRDYNKAGDVIKNLLLRRSWAFDAWTDPNKDGHKDLARGIMGTANWDNITERFKHRSDKVKEWDDDTGNCPSLSLVKKSFASSTMQSTMM